MEYLHYCVSLRKKGYHSAQIEKKLQNKGLPAEEIKHLIRASDDIILNGDDQRLEPANSGWSKLTITLALVLILIALLAAYLGKGAIGIFGCIIIWAIIRRLKFSGKERQSFFKSRF